MRNLNFSTEQVAKEFSKVLKNWLSVEEMAEIVELTKKETDPMICHTGDYCDSNMAMHAAMVNLGVLAEDDESDFDEPFMKLFNDSWDLAKRTFSMLAPPPRPKKSLLTSKPNTIRLALALSARLKLRLTMRMQQKS